MIRFLQRPSKLKKIVLGGILLFIAAAMVVTLIPGITPDMSSNQQGVLATVNGDPITSVEVDNAASRMGRRQFPRGFPENFRPYLRQQALEQMIMARTLEAEARRMGLRVTDEELRYELSTGGIGRELFPGGKFVGDQVYAEFVRSNFQLSVVDFEKLLKTDILLRKLRAVVEGAAVVPANEIEQEYRRRNTKVKFDYALISGDDLLKQINPTDDELRAFYDKNKSRYENSIPEKRKVQLAVLDPSKLAGNVQVTEDDIKRVYNERKESFRIEPSADVRHILIKTPAPGTDGKVDEKAAAAAKAKAEDILKQAKSGANFADLAKKHSEDTGSNNNGGLYEGVRRGVMVKEFEDAAFSLPIGQVSDLVKTSYGYHIIRVDKRQDARVRTLDEVRAELEPAARQQKQQEAVEREANGFVTEARTRGLAEAAQKRGLQPITTNFFSRYEPIAGIGMVQEVSEAVFNAPVKGSVQDVRAPMGTVVFQVLEVQPPKTPTFEEVKPRLMAEFRNQRASELLAQKARELSDKARAAHNLRQAAKEMGATVKSSDPVTADAQLTDLGPMSGPAGVAFTMKPGQISEGFTAGRNAAVIAVTDVQEPSLEQLATAREQIREQLLDQKRGEIMQIFASSVRKKMEDDGKIKFNEEERKRLLNMPEGGPTGGQ